MERRYRDWAARCVRGSSPVIRADRGRQLIDANEDLVTVPGLCPFCECDRLVLEMSTDQVQTCTKRALS